MFIKPMPGVLVRDPVSKELLPPDGRNVEKSGFWLRRLAEGAVVEVVVAPTPHPTADDADQPAKKKDARK